MIIFSSNLCFKSHYTSLSQGPNALTIVIWELHKLKNKENLLKVIYPNDLNFIQHKIVISQSDLYNKYWCYGKRFNGRVLSRNMLEKASQLAEKSAV